MKDIYGDFILPPVPGLFLLNPYQGLARGAAPLATRHARLQRAKAVSNLCITARAIALPHMHQLNYLAKQLDCNPSGCKYHFSIK